MTDEELRALRASCKTEVDLARLARELARSEKDELLVFWTRLQRWHVLAKRARRLRSIPGLPGARGQSRPREGDGDGDKWPIITRVEVERDKYRALVDRARKFLGKENLDLVLGVLSTHGIFSEIPPRISPPSLEEEDLGMRARAMSAALAEAIPPAPPRPSPNRWEAGRVDVAGEDRELIVCPLCPAADPASPWVSTAPLRPRSVSGHYRRIHEVSRCATRGCYNVAPDDESRRYTRNRYCPACSSSYGRDSWHVAGYMNPASV